MSLLSPQRKVESASYDISLYSWLTRQRSIFERRLEIKTTTIRVDNCKDQHSCVIKTASRKKLTSLIINSLETELHCPNQKQFTLSLAMSDFPHK